MTGKGHLVSGTVAAADAIAAFRMAGAGGAPAAVASALDRIYDFMAGGHTAGWGAAASLACLAAGYYAGLLLPDIDKDNSMLASRLRFHLAVNHRGITHSVWAIIAVVLLCRMAAWPLDAFLRGICVGMLVHCLFDSLSVAGWVPFYPLGRWRTYNGTVMTRRRGHFGLYSASNPGSEGVVNGMFVVLSAAGMAFWAYMVFWPA